MHYVISTSVCYAILCLTSSKMLFTLRERKSTSMSGVRGRERESQADFTLSAVSDVGLDFTT